MLKLSGRILEIPCARLNWQFSVSFQAHVKSSCLYRVLQGVTVHCYWGLGRTGTMLAACLVGLCHLEPNDAIREIRRRRPFSIETYEQENAVHQFAHSLKSDTPPSDETDK